MAGHEEACGPELRVVQRTEIFHHIDLSFAMEVHDIDRGNDTQNSHDSKQIVPRPDFPTLRGILFENVVIHKRL